MQKIQVRILADIPTLDDISFCIYKIDIPGPGKVGIQVEITFEGFERKAPTGGPCQAVEAVHVCKTSGTNALRIYLVIVDDAVISGREIQHRKETRFSEGIKCGIMQQEAMAV